MKTAHTIIALLLFVSTGLYAQTPHIKGIEIKNQRVEKQENHISIAMDMVLDNLTLGANEMLTLTPVIKATDSNHTIELPSVVINGATRQKAFNRSRKLNNTPAFAVEPLTVLRRHNNKKQTVTYKTAVTREQWMKKAQLVLEENVTGCAQCNKGKARQLLSERILPADFVPVYKLAYIMPEAEPVKRRSEKFAASFNYKVGRAELLRDFGNNASELAKVDRVVKEIKNDKNLTITNLTISGYASPEGTHQSNISLSERRAKTFADYLSSEYALDKNRFKIDWFGEDWKGLTAAVEKSDMPDKTEILRIIRTTDNPDARDVPLRKLSGGQTYKTLLDNYYPPLRRNEYTVAYIARAFDVEEAKQLIRTKPQYLSLNEMFLVAQTYPAESKDFKEVFDIAARLYPDSPIAIMNSAATDIEGGNMQSAVARLEKIKDNAKTWNNLGVAYARMGQLDKAEEYFAKAVAKGDSDAVNNMEQLQKLRENAE